MRLCVIFWAVLAVTAADTRVDNLENLVKGLNDTISNLIHQMRLNQFYSEERVRSNGCSGIKQVRHQRDGTRPYFTETHTGSGVASIHDHADSVRTMGMGEFHVVLNGVEFRTRHNDYLLKMPSKSNESYDRIEDVPFPQVPQSVLSQPTVEDEIKEMREYFKAFQSQDSNHRDYKPYFTPVLSYLEGAWTYVGKKLEEPFPGERHWIEAETWEELEEKSLYLAQSGNKEALENLAYLPRTIAKIKYGGGNGTEPVFAQWNYRIMCHLLKDDLPVNKLYLVDDLASRMVKQVTVDKMKETREARFTLSPEKHKEQWSPGRYVGTLLDDLMYEIPGKNNYPGRYRAIYDSVFGHVSKNAGSSETLNAAFYHHLFKIDDMRDGMGIQTRHRGFSDETLFMARTTHRKVVETKVKFCKNNTCEINEQRWSYAIPMEIIYLTPLANWNPYRIKYHGWSKDAGAKVVVKDGRDGSKEKPYNGTNSKHFFRTPAEFFTDDEFSVRPADTSRSGVYVLDERGNKRLVRASGHRIILPEIQGVGRIRQRYPIMPIHTEGTTTWKELDALKEIVMNPNRYQEILYEQSNGNSKGGGLTGLVTVTMAPASAKHGHHTHDIELSKEDFKSLYSAGIIEKKTTLSNGHEHDLHLQLNLFEIDKWQLKILTCDKLATCFDGHHQFFPQAFSNDGAVIENAARVYSKTQQDPAAETQVSSASVQHPYIWLVFISFTFYLSLH